jgi:hypothetical protein
MKKTVIKEVKKNPSIIHCSNLQNARRLFSRILDEIQTNKYNERQIRLLIYGLSQFTNLYKESEFETRIANLEKSLNKND